MVGIVLQCIVGEGVEGTKIRPFIQRGDFFRITVFCVWSLCYSKQRR